MLSTSKKTHWKIMKFRKIKIFTGALFDVPSHIVRLDDHKGTHGWQVRYGQSWKLFSDHTPDGSGAEDALRKATAELAQRINNLAAPTGLRTEISNHKSSDLPAGISGPKKCLRKGRNTPYYEFQVTLPVFGQGSKNVHIYIGTDNTMNDERRQAALLKAMALREEYMKNYQKAATLAKHRQAAALGVVRKKRYSPRASKSADKAQALPSV